jgi:hypothetical protein
LSLWKKGYNKWFFFLQTIIILRLIRGWWGGGGWMRKKKVGHKKLIIAFLTVSICQSCQIVSQPPRPSAWWWKWRQPRYTIDSNSFSSLRPVSIPVRSVASVRVGIEILFVVAKQGIPSPTSRLYGRWILLLMPSIRDLQNRLWDKIPTNTLNHHRWGHKLLMSYAATVTNSLHQTLELLTLYRPTLWKFPTQSSWFLQIWRE